MCGCHPSKSHKWWLLGDQVQQQLTFTKVEKASWWGVLRGTLPSDYCIRAFCPEKGRKSPGRALTLMIGGIHTNAQRMCSQERMTTEWRKEVMARKPRLPQILQPDPQPPAPTLTWKRLPDDAHLQNDRSSLRILTSSPQATSEF